MAKEKFNFDILFNVDCWQNDFRKAANKIMAKGDRKKIPICIPSYGRPDAKFFIHLANDFTETKNYPVHVFVRDSQIKDYENSEYLKDKSWVTIHHFPDDEISDVGLVRAKIVDTMYDLGYESIFMHDDDMNGIYPSIPSARESGPISRTWVGLNHWQTYNMWQLASEYAWHMFDRAVYTLPMVAGFSWLPDFSEEKSSYTIRGLASIAMCINIKRMKENGLNFLTDKIKHHEDFDLEIRALIKGLYPIELHWLTFHSAGSGKYQHLTSYERYEEFQKQMLEDFKDIDFVIARHRSKLPNVGINWNKAKAYLVNNGFLDGEKYSKTKYQINMWQGGKMLEYFE